MKKIPWNGAAGSVLRLRQQLTIVHLERKMRAAGFAWIWISSLLFLAGCSWVPYGVNRCAETRLKQAEAKMAYAPPCQSCVAPGVNKDYKKGWKAGYLAVSEGRTGTLPAVPPYKYRTYNYQSNGGQQAANAWYQGYAAGAASAKCQRLDVANRSHTVGSPCCICEGPCTCSSPGVLPTTEEMLRRQSQMRGYQNGIPNGIENEIIREEMIIEPEMAPMEMAPEHLPESRGSMPSIPDPPRKAQLEPLMGSLVGPLAQDSAPSLQSQTPPTRLPRSGNWQGSRPAKVEAPSAESVAQAPPAMAARRTSDGSQLLVTPFAPMVQREMVQREIARPQAVALPSNLSCLDEVPSSDHTALPKVVASSPAPIAIPNMEPHSGATPKVVAQLKSPSKRQDLSKELLVVAPKVDAPTVGLSQPKSVRSRGEIVSPRAGLVRRKRVVTPKLSDPKMALAMGGKKIPREYPLVPPAIVSKDRLKTPGIFNVPMSQLLAKRVVTPQPPTRSLVKNKRPSIELFQGLALTQPESMTPSALTPPRKIFSERTNGKGLQQPKEFDASMPMLPLARELYSESFPSVMRHPRSIGMPQQETAHGELSMPVNIAVTNNSTVAKKQTVKVENLQLGELSYPSEWIVEPENGSKDLQFIDVIWPAAYEVDCVSIQQD